MLIKRVYEVDPLECPKCGGKPQSLFIQAVRKQQQFPLKVKVA